MEATNVNTAVLSNFEVMELLKNLKHTKKKFSMRNLATITYEISNYQCLLDASAELTAQEGFELTQKLGACMVLPCKYKCNTNNYESERAHLKSIVHANALAIATAITLQMPQWKHTLRTLQFLEDSPCKLQSMQCIGTFLQAVKPFNLLKMEILSIVNDPPTSPLQIQLIVEDSEERLTDEQVDALLETISAHLPVPQEPDDPEELLE